MTLAREKGRLILVRHGAVASDWKKICYGKLDVPLCDQWMIDSKTLVENLSSIRATKVFHSGLVRSSWLAEKVATKTRDNAGFCSVVEDRRLRERDFGDWEGKSWDDVFASDPERFHDLIHQPDTYRPPGGETTSEMQGRMVHWYGDCIFPDQTIVAITHSGPIAALAGYLLKLLPDQWSPWMLGYGESLTIPSSPISGSGQLRKGFLNDQ